MRFSKLFGLVVFSAFLWLINLPVQAGPNLSLSQSVKTKLIAASPVLGKSVGQETFDGKPVLVTFFASW